MTNKQRYAIARMLSGSPEHNVCFEYEDEYGDTYLDSTTFNIYVPSIRKRLNISIWGDGSAHIKGYNKNFGLTDAELAILDDELLRRAKLVMVEYQSLFDKVLMDGVSND